MRQRQRSSWLNAIAAVGVLLALAGAAVLIVHDRDTGSLSFERRQDPARTVVLDANGGVVAVLTDGARTAVLEGPQRTIREPDTTGATITTRALVRLMPQPWSENAEHAEWFTSWFATARSTATPDIIEIALQYLHGAPDQKDDKGVRFAGSARYGPALQGQVSEFSDFNDYLGISWRYPDGTVTPPEGDRYGTLDCSGFVRMVFGYRSGYPMEYMNPTGNALPRRAVMMAEHAPGALIVSDYATHAAEIGRLQPGDLVFFDVDRADGPAVDHVGIYLGLDSNGARRFISSRKTNDGPTFGDVGGTSILEGNGIYAKGFRSARRL